MRAWQQQQRPACHFMAVGDTGWALLGVVRNWMLLHVILCAYGFLAYVVVQLTSTATPYLL
jgi:hypothetical protein